MGIELHKFPDCVDYDDVISLIEKKHNISVRDYAGKFSAETYAAKDKLKRQWMEENGYGDSWHVLDVPDKSKPRDDWDKDSEEMKLRIEINSKYRKIENELDKTDFPYLDYWHQICDYVSRGGVNYLCLEPVDPDTELPEKYQNWINEINQMIIEEVKDSPAYDADEMVLTYHVDW